MTAWSSTLPEDDDGSDNRDWFVDEDDNDIEIVSLLDSQEPIATTASADHTHSKDGDHTHNGGVGFATKKRTPTESNLCQRLILLLALIAGIMLAAAASLSRSSSAPSSQVSVAEIYPDKVLPPNNNNDDDKSTSTNSPNTTEAGQASSKDLPNEGVAPVSSPMSVGSSKDRSNEKSTPSTKDDGKDDHRNDVKQCNLTHNGREGGIQWFDLSTGNSRIDQAYRRALEELHANIKYKEDCSPYFVAGNGWDQLWTRDTAYAVELAAGLVAPEVSRLSLETCTEEVSGTTVWLQDTCGHFGGWPNLTDAIVGARGAWHYYLYTGNSTFLEWAYDVTLRSLLRAENDALRNVPNETYFRDGLFGGCSSFMESNSGYPAKYKMNGGLVAKTKALSTNILYYNGYHYAYKMGTILMENDLVVNTLKERSKALKTTIRNRLWMEDKGLYAYFEDENGGLVTQTEGLGLALVMITDDFESDHRIDLIWKSVYRTELGIPSLWPRFDHKVKSENPDTSQYYHNGRIWPFVSGYFAIAAAKHGQSDVFAEEMTALMDLSEQNDTFAEFYELDKSFPPERRRQLWSDAGFLGMVYQGLFGMRFFEHHLQFAPTKVPGPDGVLYVPDTMTLSNVKYRRAILDISISGTGTNVKSFRLNGEVQENPRIDAYLNGRQTIEIEMVE